MISFWRMRWICCAENTIAIQVRQPVPYHDFFFIAKLGYGCQTSHKSWWPLQSTFLKSTLWIGYSTPQCEAWYQKRLAKIVVDEAQPLSIADWKVDLH